MKIALTLRAYVSKTYWRHTFFKLGTLTNFLSIWGGLWLLVESIVFYSPELNAGLREFGAWFILFSVVCTLVMRRPQLSISSKLFGRDIEIEIRVGDIFEIEGGCVISTNTTFDTDIDHGLIAKDSIQGQFTTRYYNSISHLDLDLEDALGEYCFESLTERRPGKDRRYPIGTIVQLRPNNKAVYLVAIADINEHGNARTSFDNVKKCLGEIWNYVGVRGDFQPISIPLIGSGRARLTQTRDEIAKEIIRSIVASCSTKKFCEKFTIVISPSDYGKLDLHQLGEFLLYICKYTEFRDQRDIGRGKGIQ